MVSAATEHLSERFAPLPVRCRAPRSTPGSALVRVPSTLMPEGAPEAQGDVTCAVLLECPQQQVRLLGGIARTGRAEHCTEAARAVEHCPLRRSGPQLAVELVRCRRSEVLTRNRKRNEERRSRSDRPDEVQDELPVELRLVAPQHLGYVAKESEPQWRSSPVDGLVDEHVLGGQHACREAVKLGVRRPREEVATGSELLGCPE